MNLHRPETWKLKLCPRDMRLHFKEVIMRKKASKKFAAVLLTAAMCVSTLAGCGNDSQGSTPAGGSATGGSTQQSEQPSTGQDTSGGATASAFSEAPMLASMVSAGTLPAVEDRIPTAADVMVENVASVGNYGDKNIQMTLSKAGWNTGKPIEQGLFRFNSDGEVEPNVAKGYDVNNDATVYTIYLREGMKWSDGVDFTAEDCVFFYDHMCVPQTFGKSLWDCFKATDAEGNQSTATFTKVDDYTFTVSFEAPKPNFINELCINAKWCYAPKHYHETILPEFIGEEAAQKKAEEMGFSDVAKMGSETGYYFWNVAGIPTLNPWVLSTEAGKNDVNGSYFEYVRNPYYWKVDQNGQQLPYVDKIEYTLISDDSQFLTKILAGEVTIADAGWNDIETLTENADKVGFHIVQWANSSWGAANAQLELNQTAPDEDYRALFQTKEFRQALSIAVDREEFSKLISDGWQVGRQASPAEGALGYSEAWAKKWTEYDPAAAQALLEGLGMVKGSDGYYDLANGKDFVLNILSYTSSGADDTYVVLSKYWDAIGIKSTYKPMDKDTLNNNIISNEYDAVLSPVAPAETISLGLRPDTLVPVRNYAEWYGDIGTWYASGGTEGVAPTGDLLKLCELYDQLKVEADAGKRADIIDQMYKLHEENIWVIGYMESASTMFAIDNDFINFPEAEMFSDEYRGLGIAHIDCCYFAE